MNQSRPVLLELYGTKSPTIQEEFEKKGFDVLSFELTPTIDPQDFSSIQADVIWANIPCKHFSILSIGRNWNHDHTPKNESGRVGLEILRKTIEIIRVQEQNNPNVLWWFENPRGKMRRMPEVQGFNHHEVSYCQYGDNRMKPTDIWTNTDWVGREICRPKAPCHERAPRGSQKGTLKRRGSKNRVIIPADLCRDLAEFAIKKIYPL